MSNVDLRHGDCLAVMRELPDNSVDAVVCDPPYGLAEHKRKDVEKALLAWLTGDREHVPTGRGGFMGKEWDRFVPPPAVWDECFRVLKPGGHLLAFAGSRTFDLMAISIRLAGLDADVSPEIRDSIAWLYGSGFGKAGLLGNKPTAHLIDPKFHGFSTGLKPGFEPVICARKPLAKGLGVAQNVQQFGTGALNVDATRIGNGSESQGARSLSEASAETRYTDAGAVNFAATPGPRGGSPAGRWPANVALDSWTEPVLRLRYNLPVDVERTIRESFGASTSHLPAVRDIGHDRPEQSGAAEVLLAPVPGGVDVGEPDGRASAPLGQEAYGRDTGADLSHEKGQSAVRRTGMELEGREVPQQRVRLHGADGALPRGAGDVRVDGIGKRSPVHTGAPTSGSAPVRPRVAAGGGGASHQRVEDGQPAGEPGASRIGPVAPNEAHRGRRGDVQAAAGERSAAGPALEVLRSECPPAWWQHFEVVGERRGGQAAALDQMSGTTVSRKGKPRGAASGEGWGMTATGAEYDDQGGASRFFLTAEPDAPDLPIDELAERFMYCAKAPKSERPTYVKEDQGQGFLGGKSGIRKRCTICGKQQVNSTPSSMCSCPEPDWQADPSMQGVVSHPTVKPLALMRWLVRLVTPPGGTVLEPFAGSGATVEAAILEGFDVIAIEREADYLPLIQARIFRAQAKVAAAEESVEPPKKAKGRWPANVALDEESAEALDVQSGIIKSSPVGFNNNPITVTELSARPFKDGDQRGKGYTDTGGASRFFFVAKSEEPKPAPAEPEVWRDGAQQPDLFDEEETA